MQRFIQGLVIVLLALLSCSNSRLSLAQLLPDKDDTDFVVGGYLPDYRFYINVNETVLQLTDLYLFSTDFDPTAKQKFSDDNDDMCCLNKDHFAKVQQARAYRAEQLPDGTKPLKVWLTVGGAGRSGGFQVLFNQALDQINPFLDALVEKCEEYDLYGIDFDNQVFGENDLRHYISFLNLAAQHLGAHGRRVSITLRPGIWIPSLATKAVNRVNVMAYDGPFAYLKEHVQPAIDATIKSGVPRSSIVLGFPAYARSERNPNDVKTFSEIYDDVMEKSGKADADAPDMEGIDTRSKWDGFVIDSPAIIREKAQYAKDKGLKGIYIWELGQDKQHEWFAPSGFLLQSAATFGNIPEPIQNNHGDGSKDEL